MRDFIEAILGSATGNAFMSRASGKTAKGKPNVNIHETFSYPDELDKMVAWAEKYQNEDVYISPLLYGDKVNDRDKIARTPENALTSQTIYMDSDLCKPEYFRVKPSIHVVTSTGRGHDYWVLDEPIPAKDAAEIAHKITTAHADDGCDPSGWSANKLLRVPGTVNTSHGFPESVVAEFTGELYFLADIADAYADVELYERPIMGRVSNAVEIVQPEDMPPYEEALQKLPQRILELALAEPTEEQDRSSLRYKLLCDLFRMGDELSYEEVLTIAWNAPASRKWSQEDVRGIKGLMMEANKAQVEIMWEIGAMQEPPEEESVPESEGLLTEAERQQLVGYTTWHDRYMQWAKAKLPKQNAPYDRLNAWIVLSAVFSDVAFIPRKNGPEGLNLYGMQLGETTSGKSASLKLRKMVMDECFMDDKGYYLGGNASPNALGKKLLERDGKVSLFAKDEAHGLFKQWTTQDWTTGMMEDLALLYDGEVPPMLRMQDKDAGKVAKTHFIMHLMGTPEEITRSLNRDMFKSGFLARFVWSIGEPRQVTKDTVREEDGDGKQAMMGFEPMARQWAAEFAEIKRRLRSKSSTATIAIGITKEAADRMTEVKWDLTNLVKKSDGNYDILNPSLVRMGVTIRKCASLLALADGKETTELIHVLKAIESAEEWVKNLLIVAQSISASDFERSCDEVEAFVHARNDRVKLEVVHRRFRAWRVRDLTEAISALVSQGRLRTSEGKEGKWIETNR